MRLFVCTLCIVLLGLLLAGCSAMPSTQPVATLTEPLRAATLDGTGAVLLAQTLDLRGDAQWRDDQQRLEQVEECRLACDVMPLAAAMPALDLCLLVSDDANLTADTIDQAESITDCHLPAAGAPFQYDSGFVTLSARAGSMMRDGHFTLYLYTARGAQMTLKSMKLAMRARMSFM